MQPFLPPKAAPIVFGFLVSCLMSFIVTGIATLNALSLAHEHFMQTWLSSWLQSWAVAFPVILFVAPAARAMLGRLVKKPDSAKA